MHNSLQKYIHSQSSLYMCMTAIYKVLEANWQIIKEIKELLSIDPSIQICTSKHNSKYWYLHAWTMLEMHLFSLHATTIYINELNLSTHKPKAISFSRGIIITTKYETSRAYR